MQIQANNPIDYIAQIPEERKEPLRKLREVILQNLPKGFEETISYGMIGYVVPHTLYPAGYHCDPSLPLPFMAIASQKNFIAVYHMGIYTSGELMNWFLNEHSKHSPKKLDMGKSCIRFKNITTIPYELIGMLSSKIALQEWIELYEKNIKPSKNGH